MCVYIYIYIHINFKAMNNVLDVKMVLKHIYSLKIFRFLYRSFRQYNKILTKHQTKINTAIIKNLKKNQNFKILKSIVKKNKLKIVYKSIYVQKQSSKGVLQERRCTNTKQTHRRITAQKRNLKKAALQLY